MQRGGDHANGGVEREQTALGAPDSGEDAVASTKNTRTLANLDAIVDDLDLGSANASGHLKVYSGTAPTDVDTALSGNTLLAELVMSNPAFGSAADQNPGGAATASAITADTDADATGTATFCRLTDRDGTARIQLSVTATGGGGEVTLNSAVIQQHARVEVTALAITLADS